MIKNVLLLFGTLVLFIINTIVIVDLKITPNSPSEVEPGAEFTFEINIAKGEVSGFAKIQQQLPAGFTAEAVETKGASFTFSDGRVKFIWMSLPAEEEFTISYKVKVGDNVSGDFQVGGKFSYLENNERKSVEIPNQQITVKAPETAEVTEPEEQPEETQSAETEPEVPAVTEPEETPTSSETSSSTEAATQAESGCTRAIADNGDGTYNVDVTIAIPGVSGFAKAQDILPAPLKADQGEVAGAVFSFVSQKAKFVWMSVPGGPETKISYVVDLNGGSPDLLNNITGMFQYLKDNQTQKVPITTIS
ncbi:hypothetical protein JYU20_04605, partial [Bacteroidales bacterium AH-315-I05]|nr:hypothetical protein [Bacteroidales bacterium AH-315-I05]